MLILFRDELLERGTAESEELRDLVLDFISQSPTKSVHRRVFELNYLGEDVWMKFLYVARKTGQVTITENLEKVTLTVAMPVFVRSNVIQFKRRS